MTVTQDVKNAAADLIQGALDYWGGDPGKWCQGRFTTGEGARCLNAALAEGDITLARSDARDEHPITVARAAVVKASGRSISDYYLVTDACIVNNVSTFKKLQTYMRAAIATLRGSASPGMSQAAPASLDYAELETHTLAWDRATRWIGAAVATAAAPWFLSGDALAQKSRAIYGGGPTGAYSTLFCPPLPPVLTNAQFPGYACQSCEKGKPCGSTANIERVLAEPTTIGFSQLDVFALESGKNPDLTKKLTVVRQLACEGLWLVTKNPRVNNYGDVLGLAKRLPFAIAAGGARATFGYMQSIDKEGLGRASGEQLITVDDARAAIDNVAKSTDGRVGFFVQFADPENANIRAMIDSKLKVIPVLSRELLRTKVAGQDVYQLQDFTLKAGYTRYGTETARTACTPAVIVTGNPESMNDPKDRDNQKDMIDELRKVDDRELLPKEGRVAALMRGFKRVTGPVLEEMMAAVEAAKKKTESQN